MKKILLILPLLTLSVGLYLLNKPQTVKKIDIPKIVIPKKSIEFTIIKDKNNHLEFRGVFSQQETPKHIAKLLSSGNLEHHIKINSKLASDKEAILVVEKIIKDFIENSIEFSIVYKNKKLLIDGKMINKADKERIESLLTLSNINSFSNIKVVQIPLISDTKELDVLSKLKLAVEKREGKSSDDKPTEDEVQNILSNLKSLAPEASKRTEPTKKAKIIKKIIKKIVKKEKIIKKEKIVKKKKVIKKKKPIKTTTVTKKKRPLPTPTPTPVAEPVIIYKTVYIEQPTEQPTPAITAEEYRKKLENASRPDEEVMSLPMVKTVDMDIEDKIKKGEVKPLSTPKPLVEEKTIQIPSDEKKIDKDIPWANLHEVEEKVEGVLLNESIN